MTTHKPQVARLALQFEAIRYALQIRHGRDAAPIDEEVLAELRAGGEIPERTTVGDMRSKPEQSFAHDSCRLLLVAYNAAKRRAWYRSVFRRLDDPGLEDWCKEALGRLGRDEQCLAKILGGRPGDLIGVPPWTGRELRRLLLDPSRFDEFFKPAARGRKRSPARLRLRRGLAVDSPAHRAVAKSTEPAPAAAENQGLVVGNAPAAVLDSEVAKSTSDLHSRGHVRLGSILTGVLVAGLSAWLWRAASLGVPTEQRPGLDALPTQKNWVTPILSTDLTPPVQPAGSARSGPAAPNTAPSAAIHGLAQCHPRSPAEPCEVVLTAVGADPDRDSLSYQWEGCSREGGEADTCVVVVGELGRRRVALTVSDGRGGRGVALKDVEGVNRPPEVVLSRSDDGCAPSPAHPCRVILTAEVSDGDGDEMSFAWDGCATGQGTLGACLAATVGAHRARITVRDGWTATLGEAEVVAGRPDALCASWAELARRIQQHGALMSSMCAGDVGGTLSRNGSRLDLPGAGGAEAAPLLASYRQGLRVFRPQVVGEHRAAEAVRSECRQREQGEASWFTSWEAVRAEMDRLQAAWCNRNGE